MATASWDFSGFAPSGNGMNSVLGDLMGPACKAFWDERVRSMPSVFGRLAFVSSLRASQDGKYAFGDLEARFGSEASQRALKATHLQTFWEWLEYSLEEKQADLDIYLNSLPDHRRQIVESWHSGKPYTFFVPYCATEAELELYSSELDLLFALLACEYGLLQ
jgi:hypothetical protein